jgi:penicillin-binding protein-related factor A (putative recombinase)
MSGRPKNASNDGRLFETMIERTADAYFNARILRLCKVEPPVRVIGWGQNRKVIFLENPFPDWTGAWTERAGRSLMIETKSTSDPRLPMAASGNLSENQVEWLKRWHYAGAAVGIIWEWKNNGAAFIPIGQAVDIWKSGRRHIKWEECDPIRQGTGFVLIDFVENLRRWYPHE